MVSEVEYMVDLLDTNWDAAVTALKTTGGDGTIADIHGVHPIVMDIRDMGSAKSTDAQGRAKGGNRISMGKKTESVDSGVTYSRDIIVVMETGNSVNYPTVGWDIRDETYNLSISIRTRQDDRTLNDGTRVSATGSFGVQRIQSLYLLVRYIIEQKRRGWLKTGSAIYENINQIVMGERSESNDKKNRIFGYKVNITLKRLARPV
jgi:hypothetical protein